MFILAALREFNSGTLESFLDISWKVYRGNESFQDNNTTVISLCASHLMTNSESYAMEIIRDIPKLELTWCVYWCFTSHATIFQFYIYDGKDVQAD